MATIKLLGLLLTRQKDDEQEEGKGDANEKVTPDIKNIECGQCGHSKRMWLFERTHAFTYVSCGHVVCVYIF